MSISRSIQPVIDFLFIAQMITKPKDNEMQKLCYPALRVAFFAQEAFSGVALNGP